MTETAHNPALARVEAGLKSSPRNPERFKDFGVESKYLQEAVLKGKDGRVRSTVRLSDEGRKLAQETWDSMKSLIPVREGQAGPSFDDIKLRAQQEMQRLKSSREAIKDPQQQATANFLRLMERSLQMRVEHQRRIKVAEELKASNTPWLATQEIYGANTSAQSALVETFFGNNKGAVPKAWVNDRLTEVRQVIDQELDACVQKGLFNASDKLAWSAYYDQFLSERVVAFVHGKKLGGQLELVKKEGLQELISRVIGAKKLDEFIFINAHMRAQSVNRQRQAEEDRRKQELLTGIQNPEGVKQASTEAQSKTLDQLTAFESTKKRPSRLSQFARIWLPTSWRKAAVAAAIAIGTLGQGHIQSAISHFQTDSPKPEAAALVVSGQPISAALETAQKLPNPHPEIRVDTHLRVPEVIREPVIARGAFIAKSVDIFEPGTNNRLNLTTPGKIEVTEIKDLGNGTRRLVYKIGAKTVESPDSQVLLEGEKNPQSNRVGIRVNSETVHWANEAGAINIRVAGNASKVSESGKLDDADLVKTLDQAKAEGRKVDFVFNPNTMPYYDQIDKDNFTYQDVIEDEPKIRAEIRKRLQAILSYDNVGILEIGNEPNDPFFWHKGALGSPERMQSYAKFAKMVGEEARKIKPEIKLAIAALADPIPNEEKMREMYQFLKAEGFDFRNTYAAVHQYQEKFGEAIKLTRQVSGIEPMVTEVGVDANTPDAVAKLERALSESLSLTGGPIFAHEFHNLEGVPDVGTGAQFAMNRGDPRFVAFRELAMTDARKSPQVVAQGPQKPLT